MTWFYCSCETVGSAGEGRGAAFSGHGSATWQSETCPFALGGRCKDLAWCLDQPQMVRRGFVLQLESIWGWWVGSVNFPPFLSSGELFSINYMFMYIRIYFFLGVVVMSWCPGSIDQARFSDLLVVPWMATRLQSCPSAAVWAESLLLLVCLILSHGQCKAVWWSYVQNLGNLNEENLISWLSIKIWRSALSGSLMSILFSYILNKVSLV